MIAVRWCFMRSPWFVAPGSTATVFLELAIEGTFPDAQHPRGFLAVAAAELQSFDDEILFDGLERLAEQGIGGGRSLTGGADRGGLNVLGQVVHVEHAVSIDHDHALDD